MIKTLIAAMAASVIATATPASAEGKPNAEPSATAPVATLVPAANPESSARAANPDRRYCVVDTVTGSRIPMKVCRTRQVWLLNGFDPLAK